MERLQTRLGYRFSRVELLQQALTHRSFSGTNNERLEFLGDGLLNFVVGECAYRARSAANEGELSRLRASMVREETLSQVARRLQLGDLLRLGPGELKSGGFRRDSTLADAVEAILGAVYLDGGFAAASEVCQRIFDAELATLPEAQAVKDPKTRLQEWLQAKGRPLPEYALIQEVGPPHQRQFITSCRLLDAQALTQGEGSSRKLAEQAAALRMLQTLENDGTKHS